MKELRGRTAVVTGGGSGLGAAIARRFAREGMRVVVADIARDSAARTADELRAQGAEVIACEVDVGSRTSLEALAREVRAFGGCHLVCANVGVQRIGRAGALSARDWEWLVGVNLLGTVATIDALLPLVREANGERHLVFTSSISGLVAAPRLAAYTASKFAVTGYAETLRIELADEGIGVSVLFPGGMATTHLASSALARPAALGEQPALDPDDVREVAAVLGASRAEIVDPDYAVRHLVAAVRENRPYLVTHATARAAFEARLDALRAAFARADEPEETR